MKGLFLAMVLAVGLCCSGMASAMVQRGHLEGANFTMDYPLVYAQNAAAQKAINGDIYTYIARVQGNAAAFEKSSLNYSVKYEDARLISLVFVQQEYRARAAHGSYHYYGVVYDKNTGARIPLSNYLRVTPEQVMQEAENSLYTLTGKKIPYRWQNFSLKSVPDRYFLLGNGEIAVLFEPYDMDCYAMGATYVRFSREKLAYYNSRNS